MKERFRKFLEGRYILYYGMDQLSKFLLILFFIFSIASIAIEKLRPFNFISTFIFIYVYYRLLSRNISKRIEENNKFLSMSKPYLNKISIFTKNIRDRDYKYVRCDLCDQELRLPRKKGKIRVTCKRCGHKFETRT